MGDDYSVENGNICKPIVYADVYPLKPELTAPVYMDYLEQQGYTSVLEYLESIEEWDPYKIMFFHRVCTKDVLLYDYLSGLEKTVEDIRIEILKKLLEIDPRAGLRKEYQEELNECRRYKEAEEIQEGFSHSRVFIDRKEVIQYLSEAYWDEFSKLQKIRSLLPEEQVLNSVVLGRESVEKYKEQLEKIIEIAKKVYLNDSPHSLEYNLGTRIRHVLCEEVLTYSLEEQHFLCKKSSDNSSTYDVNTYLSNHYKGAVYYSLMQCFQSFTERIRGMIYEIRDKWIHIRNSAHPEGMFDYDGFSERFMDHFELNLEKDLGDEKQFFKIIIDALDQWTDRILCDVRNRIEEEVKPFYNEALTELTKDIASARVPNSVAVEFQRSVEVAKGKAELDINKFIDAFKMTRYRTRPFMLGDAVEHALNIGKKENPLLYKVNVQNKCSLDQKYDGSIFYYFLDVLLLLINNAVEHSGIRNAEYIFIKIDIHELSAPERDQLNVTDDSNIVLSVVNNLDESVNVKELKRVTDEIQESISQEDFLEKSTRSRGSGFYKMIRLIHYYLGERKNIRFNIEKDYFKVIFILNLEPFVVPEESDENYLYGRPGE